MRSKDTTITEPTTDREGLREASVLRRRAESLRQQAEALDEVLAIAYRRRASELEMEAWLLAVQSGAEGAEIRPAA